MQNPQNMEEEIIKFINNPAEDNTEKIYEYLSKLCIFNYKSRIGYSQSKFCAISGEELKENPITIHNYNFSPQKISQYYLRDGILDVSIGDLKFSYFDGFSEDIVIIELTFEILQSIYGDNLNQLLKEADHHFNERKDQPVTFICQKTGRSGVLSEQLTVNEQKVCSEWVHLNKDQLSGDQRKQIESQYKFQYGIGNSQSIY